MMGGEELQGHFQRKEHERKEQEKESRDKKEKEKASVGDEVGRKAKKVKPPGLPSRKQ